MSQAVRVKTPLIGRALRGRSLYLAALIMVLAAIVPLLAASPVAAASTCISSTPPGVSHPAAVAPTPSTQMGVFGAEPPLSGHPSWDGADRVNALAFDPATNTIVAGGVFNAYVWNGQTYPVNNVVAFDATTGAPVTSFRPNVDGEVLTVAFSCTGVDVFIGGSFHHVNGITRNYAAKLSLSTGAPISWNPNPNHTVESIALLRGHLIVAGNFTSIGGVARSNIASVGQTTATVDSWLNLTITGSDPDGPQQVIKVIGNHAGTAATILGNFNDVNGKAHREIAMLHLTDSSASLYTWNTPLTTSHLCSAGYANSILDAAYTPGDTRLVTVSTGGAHASSLCDVATKWDATATSNTAAQPMAQQWTGGDSMSGIACTSDDCFVGGHFRWGNNPPIWPQILGTDCSVGSSHAGYNCAGPTAVDRPGVEEIDIASMTVTAWNPTHSRQTGMHDAFLITTRGVFDASDGDDAGGIPLNDLAFWSFG